MPSYVLKESPESHYYVVWSTVTESPYFGGTRAETAEWLTEHARMTGRQEADPDRFARADRTGSSAKWPSSDRPYLGWQDWGAIYLQRGTVPRNRIGELTRRLMADENADVTDLLEPFEDETEVRP